MTSFNLKQFQEQVSDLLLRHRSILDVLSKYQQTNSTVHRSVVKSITECGCLEVHASKQQYSNEMTMDEAKKSLETHVNGQLCENCREAIEAEIGRNLFYMSSLCNLLDVDLEDIASKESQTCSTLGQFHLS